MEPISCSDCTHGAHLTKGALPINIIHVNIYELQIIAALANCSSLRDLERPRPPPPEPRGGAPSPPTARASRPPSSSRYGTTTCRAPPPALPRKISAATFALCRRGGSWIQLVANQNQRAEVSLRGRPLSEPPSSLPLAKATPTAEVSLRGRLPGQKGGAGLPPVSEAWRRGRWGPSSGGMYAPKSQRFYR